MGLPQKFVQRSAVVAQKLQPATGSGIGAGHGTGGLARPGGRSSARSVGQFVPALTRTAFEKFGFSTAALITDWPQIVGAALAQATTPERIRWPRTVAQDAAAGRTGTRSGATLHLVVDPARALDVQYQAQLIIERVNSYFGYRAVAELRIVQASPRGDALSAPAMPSRRPTPATPTAADPMIEAIGDEGLRAALMRMQQGLQARRR